VQRVFEVLLLKVDEMKTAELTGPALDWAVAKCENFARITVWQSGVAVCRSPTYEDETFWDPSTDWSQGGPIIDRERISTWTDYTDCNWTAKLEIFSEKPPRYAPTEVNAYGPTALIAAMRCYVASKLGDEVHIPESLK
jgi:hypothetical protein